MSVTFEDLWRRLEDQEERIEALELENEKVNQELAEMAFGHSRAHKNKPKYSRDMKVETYVEVYYKSIIEKSKQKGQECKLPLEAFVRAALNSPIFMGSYGKYTRNESDDRPTIYMAGGNDAWHIRIGTVESYKQMQGKTS
jgi:hypothetical protein